MDLSFNYCWTYKLGRYIKSATLLSSRDVLCAQTNHGPFQTSCYLCVHFFSFEFHFSLQSLLSLAYILSVPTVAFPKSSLMSNYTLFIIFIWSSPSFKIDLLLHMSNCQECIYIQMYPCGTLHCSLPRTALALPSVHWLRIPKDSGSVFCFVFLTKLSRCLMNTNVQVTLA